MKYNISGDNLQLVTLEIDPNEKIYAEAGSMVYMSNNIEMEAKLREMIVYAYGTDVYKEMLREREQIRMRRIRAEMERDAMRENMIWGSAVLFVFGLLCYVTYIAIEALA